MLLNISRVILFVNIFSLQNMDNIMAWSDSMFNCENITSGKYLKKYNLLSVKLIQVKTQNMFQNVGTLIFWLWIVLPRWKT